MEGVHFVGALSLGTQPYNRPTLTLTGLAAALDPAAGQLVEKLLIEVLVGFLASHGQEDVAADELVNNFAVRRETLENNVFIVLKLYHHVPRFPVDVPSLHC